MVPVRGPRKSTAAQSNASTTTDPLAVYLPQAAAPLPQKKGRGKGKARKANKTRASTPESEFVCFTDSETESDRLPLAKRRKRTAGVSNYQPPNAPQIINATDPFSTSSSSGYQWPNPGMALCNPPLPSPIVPTIVIRPQFSYPADQMQLVHVPRPPTAPATSIRASNGKPRFSCNKPTRRSSRLLKAGPLNTFGSICYK